MKFVKLFMMAFLFISTTVFAQVNINTASAKELSALKGIGEKKAAAIIKYRKANGQFKTVKELVNVPGIGEVILSNLGRDVSVSGNTDVTKLRNKKATTKNTTAKKTEPSKTKANNKKTTDKKAPSSKSKIKSKPSSKAKTETKKTKKSKKSKKNN